MNEVEEYRERIERHQRRDRQEGGQRQYDPHFGSNRYISSPCLIVDAILLALIGLIAYAAVHIEGDTTWPQTTSRPAATPTSVVDRRRSR